MHTTAGPSRQLENQPRTGGFFGPQSLSRAIYTRSPISFVSELIIVVKRKGKKRGAAEQFPKPRYLSRRYDERQEMHVTVQNQMQKSNPVDTMGASAPKVKWMQKSNPVDTMGASVSKVKWMQKSNPVNMTMAGRKCVKSQMQKVMTKTEVGNVLNLRAPPTVAPPAKTIR